MSAGKGSLIESLGGLSEAVAAAYRNQCEWQQREQARLTERLNREAEMRSILYRGLSRRQRMRLYDRMVKG